MTNYGHAAELSQSQPPEDQLRFLVSELGRWAKLNPALVPLWAEFSRVSQEISAT
jgi:hypothetical protein